MEDQTIVRRFGFLTGDPEQSHLRGRVVDFLTDKDSWSFIFNTGPICVIKYKNIVGKWPIVETTANFEKLTGWTEADWPQAI